MGAKGARQGATRRAPAPCPERAEIVNRALELWEAGKGAPHIAEVLGIPSKSVSNIVTNARVAGDPRAISHSFLHLSCGSIDDWSAEKYLEMDEKFCAAMKRAIESGKERLPVVPKMVACSRPARTMYGATPFSTVGSPAAECAA